MKYISARTTHNPFTSAGAWTDVKIQRDLRKQLTESRKQSYETKNCGAHTGLFVYVCAQGRQCRDGRKVKKQAKE